MSNANFSRVWSDREYRQRLMTAPQAVLHEFGIAVPDGVAVKTVASKGAPGDAGDVSLLQFLLERDQRLAHFFLPAPSSPCAQQAAYGTILSKAGDDPVFAQRLQADAAAALGRRGGGHR
jgi:hypothetical protein